MTGLPMTSWGFALGRIKLNLFISLKDGDIDIKQCSEIINDRVVIGYMVGYNSSGEKVDAYRHI